MDMCFLILIFLYAGKIENDQSSHSFNRSSDVGIDRARRREGAPTSLTIAPSRAHTFLEDKMMTRTTLLLLALFPWARIAALAPPHPDFTADDWKTLNDMRQRNNFTHDYKPSHISNFECKLSTEEDCRNNDEEARLPKQDDRRLNPTIGSNVKVLVLLVRFKDEQNTDIPPMSHFEELFNGNGRSAINPAGSVRQYLRYSSLGKYNVEFVIRDWVDLPDTEEFYAKGVSGLIGNVPQQELFRSAMETIDEEFGFLEWFDYDTVGVNGEGNDGTLSVGGTFIYQRWCPHFTHPTFTLTYRTQVFWIISL
jgi:hypothetical protein